MAVMTAGDVPEFAELFLKARGAGRGWNRQPDITVMLAGNSPCVKLVDAYDTCRYLMFCARWVCITSTPSARIY